MENSNESTNVLLFSKLAVDLQIVFQSECNLLALVYNIGVESCL